MFSLFTLPAPPSGGAVAQPVESSDDVLTEMLILYPRLAAQLNKGRTSKVLASNYIPNPFRPNVPAHQRLFFWISPQARAKRRVLHATQSPKQIAEYDNALELSFAASTRTTYGSALADWIKWCDENSIPESKRLPTTATDLRLFLSHKVGVDGGAKTHNVLSGLQAWHTIQDVPWPDGDKLVSLFRRAVTTNAPASSTRPPRDPVTVQHLRAVLAHTLRDPSPPNVAIYATACVAFWGLCRLGELTCPATDTEPSHRVRRDCRLSVPWHSFQLPTPQSLSLHLPWTKTTRNAGAALNITEWPDCIDVSPTRALFWHMRKAWMLPPAAPLFAFESPGGQGWTPMSKNLFLSRCRAIWREAGLGECSGHSFRIGGTTELLLRGMSRDSVMLQGRWLSDAWTRYVREHPQIIQLEITRVQNQT